MVADKYYQKSNFSNHRCLYIIFHNKKHIQSYAAMVKQHKIHKNNSHINCNLYAYAANNPVHYIDPDGREASSTLRMGGYKLNSTQVFDFLVETVKNAGLMGKPYSTDSKNTYVCTTFVEEALHLIAASKDEYLPGGQKVVNSVVNLGELIKSNGSNPSEGTYVFYFINEDGKTGHTGFVNFDKEGNAKILHNGSDCKGNKCVNLYLRDSRDLKTWFNRTNTGELYYKKLEVDIWQE